MGVKREREVVEIEEGVQSKKARVDDEINY